MEGSTLSLYLSSGRVVIRYMLMVRRSIFADFLAMWSFAIGFVHFTTEYSVYRTVGKGAGLAMAVMVPGVTLVWMCVGWQMAWYGRTA